MIFITGWILSKYLKLNMNFILTTSIDYRQEKYVSIFIWLRRPGPSSVYHNIFAWHLLPENNGGGCLTLTAM